MSGATTHFEMPRQQPRYAPYPVATSGFKQESPYPVATSGFEQESTSALYPLQSLLQAAHQSQTSPFPFLSAPTSTSVSPGYLPTSHVIQASSIPYPPNPNTTR